MRIEFKPLLEIGGKTLLEHSINLFQNTGINDIVTVTGYRSEDLVPVIAASSSRYVMNKNFESGMFSSIQLGVLELREACDAFFLLPVDIPFVRSATIRHLINEFSKDQAILACYPQYQTRRGHPPLIDCSLADRIISYKGREGMRGFLRKYKDRSMNVSVNDPFTLMDVDTQEDLSRIKKELVHFMFVLL